MKEELIGQLRDLLQAEDIMLVRDQVKNIRSNWKAESVKERQLQWEQFKSENAEGAEADFVYAPHELEGTLQELLKEYEDKIQVAGKALAQERARNFEIKSDLCDRMERLTKNEENIGKAFSLQKEIKGYWDNTGDVPGDKYPALIDRWHKSNQDFFYHINIYKELQANDLKVNHKLKEELMELAKGLSAIESINELEVEVRRLQREWMLIGPSPRETFQQMGDDFFGVLRVEQERVQAHYDTLSASSNENLSKKTLLIQRMKEILELDLSQSNSWNKWTEEVLKLQEEWKTIGWVKKKENEEIWQEFRGLCDLFFTKRGTYFESRKEVYEKNKKAKETIINEAKTLQDSSDWKLATEGIKKLQDSWKQVGGADPKEEQKLWQRFRSACDMFFQRKKEHFGELTGLQEENLKLKEALLTEIENTPLSGNKNEDLSMLRLFNERWQALGHVPREHYATMQGRHKAAFDDKYGKLNTDRKEADMTRYKSRIETIKSTGDKGLGREKMILLDKIDKLKGDVKSYENNMGIFTGKGAESMRKEIEKKILSAKREIAEILEKISLIPN
jgi:hypothetical protein